MLRTVVRLRELQLAVDVTDTSSRTQMRLRTALSEIHTETMVVFAVVAILAALLMPTLSKSKKSALSVACKSNLRQLGIALNFYSGETGFYPPSLHIDSCVSGFVTYGWPARLLPHVSGSTAVFKCPSTSPDFAWPTNRSSLGYQFPYNVGKDEKISYGYNAWGVAAVGGLGLGDNPLNAMPVSKVVKPADMIAIADSDGNGGADAEITFHRYL